MRNKVCSWIASGALLALVLGKIGRWWIFNLLEHWQYHFVAIFLIAILLANPTKWRVLFLLLVVGLIFGRITQTPQLTPTAPTISITHLNLNRGEADAFAYLRDRADDIIFLQELTPPVEEQLPVQLPDYRVILAQSLWNTHGSAMLVRDGWDGEVISAEFIHLPPDSPRILLTTIIEFHGQQITLMSLHVTRPSNKHTTAFQQTELHEISQWSQQISTPLLLIGDFNATPWSSVQPEWHLQDSYRGWQPTWPGRIALLGIPIDNALHSPDLLITKREVGAYVGSDHRPLHITFSYK